MNMPGNNGSSASAAAKRVLIVDDNRDAALSLSMLLRLSGNHTQTAHDGLEAIERAAEFRPDVVLLDIGLPKLDGHEVCRRLRQQPWGKNLLLVALSGWAEDLQNSPDVGFDHHLVKPVSHSTLVGLLDALSGKRPQAE